MKNIFEIVLSKHAEESNCNVFLIWVEYIRIEINNIKKNF